MYFSTFDRLQKNYYSNKIELGTDQPNMTTFASSILFRNSNGLSMDGKSFDNEPILLTDNDVNNFGIYHAKQMFYYRLYLHKVSSLAWVPLFSIDAGFLLKNGKVISYGNVNSSSLGSQRKSEINTMTYSETKQLLLKFNTNVDDLENGFSIHKPNKQQRVLVLGKPFMNTAVQSHNIRTYKTGHTMPNNFCCYNSKTNQFKYKFLITFAIVYHCTTMCSGYDMVTTFNQAAVKARIGTSNVYHSGSIYIPFVKATKDRIVINSNN